MLHPFFHDLNPPSIRLDADLEFVLRVAFGSSFGGTRPASSEGALRWAQRLGLECRLAERLSSEQARSFLEPLLVTELENFRKRSATEASASAGALTRLKNALRDSKIEVALLRQFALEGDEKRCRRDAAIDVLVRADDERRFAIALIESGFVTDVRCRSPLAARVARPTFADPSGAAIGVHTDLKFLRMVPGGVFIDFDCLKRCGQLVPDESAARGLCTPSKSVQAADITAQLLVERRFWTECSPLPLWLVAHELGLGYDEDLAFDAYLMLQTDVEHAEFEALRELLRALNDGAFANLSKRARVLLNHIIATTTVRAYRVRLQLQRRAQVWQHEGHLERAAESVGRALYRFKSLRTRS